MNDRMSIMAKSKMISSIVLVLYIFSTTSIAENNYYVNQTIFDNDIGSATLYTKDLGNLSQGEAFHIKIQSGSSYPWEITVYKTMQNGNRIPWISTQCIPPQKIIETEVIDAGSYQLELRPRSLNAEANLGVIRVNPGELSTSIEWHLSVSKRIKASALADELRKKADDLEDQRKYDEAMQAYNDSIEIDPGNYKTWNNKGVTLSDMGRLDDSIEAFEKAIMLNSSSTKIWKNMGYTLLMQAKYNESIHAYDKAIEIDSNDAGAWLGKGKVLSAQGRYDEAIICLDKSTALDPNSSESWIEKSDALFKQGEYDKSLEASERAIELNPNDAIAWNNKAAALGRLGDPDGEIQACKKAIELDPLCGLAWNNRGVALNALGQTAEAKDAFNKAKELGYND